jgi:hypothetical protein
VICIINFKNTLFKGFTRGDPWAPSLMKQNLNRTHKYKVIAFKKNKKRLLRTLQGRGLGLVISTGRKTTKHLQREDGMGGLVRT